MHRSILVILMAMFSLSVPIAAQEIQGGESCATNCIFLPLVARPLPQIVVDSNAGVPIVSLNPRVIDTVGIPYKLTWLGEVENRTGDIVYLTQLIAWNYNAAGELLGYYNFFVSQAALAPGERGSFMHGYSEPNNEVTRVVLTTAWEADYPHDVGYATLLEAEIHPITGLSNSEVVASIRNDQDRELYSMRAIVTFYDSEGRVVYVAAGFSPLTNLDPGETGIFTAPLSLPEFRYATVRFQVQGFMTPYPE
jgi:hypothetical protein